MPLLAKCSDGGAAQAWQCNQPHISRRLWLDRPSIGRVLIQRIVNPVLLVIADVVADEAAKVLFIQRDHMIENVSAAAPDPTFCGSVLPGRLNARPLWFKSGGLQEGNNICVEDRVAIQDDVAIRSLRRERLRAVAARPNRPTGVASH